MLINRYRKKFDRLLDNLRSKLAAHQQVNAERKQQLITQVDALLETSDKRAATEKVKHLQAQWQKVGVVPRKQEQKLWRLFRASCDAVFAQRQQQSVEFKADTEYPQGGCRNAYPRGKNTHPIERQRVTGCPRPGYRVQA